LPPPAAILRAIREERARREAERERERVARDAGQIRARCETLAGFVQEAWRIVEPETPLVWGWALDAVCQHLEAVTKGEILRLLITIPPGMMKSLLVSVFWPAWEWTQKPSLRYLTTSYSQDNVIRDNTKMRRLVESEWYQSLWGDVVRLSSDQNAKGKFENTATGGREGRAFTSMTGGRGDRVIIDDPHSTTTAESEQQRTETIKTFRESIPDRINNVRTSAIVIIMQRLHEGDVAGTVLSLGLPYVHLCLPMEFEKARRCATAIGFTDPRSYEGELLFPERFPRAAMEAMKLAKGSYAWAGQYQQRPAPREGGMFKRSWFKTVDAAPANATRVRRWDLAATIDTGESDPDWTVGLRMARTSDGVFYIEDVVRLRGSAAEVERVIKATAEQEPDVPIILPQDPGASGKAYSQYLIRTLAGRDVRAVLEKQGKELRAAPVSAQAEAGNIKIVRGAWNEAFLDEVALFPGAKHDDQIDAMSGAFLRLIQGVSMIFGSALSELLWKPFKLPDHWPRVYAVHLDHKGCAAVWGAKDPETDVVYLYAEHRAPGAHVAIHADSLKARGRWLPLVFDPEGANRSKADGDIIAWQLQERGLDVYYATSKPESDIVETVARVGGGRFKVFDTMSGWISEYGKFTRDEKGKPNLEECPLMLCTSLLATTGLQIATTEDIATKSYDEQDGWSDGDRSSVTGY